MTTPVLSAAFLFRTGTGSVPKCPSHYADGDVAKKCYNKITKNDKEKRCPCYLHLQAEKHGTFYQGIRIMPSYIMTGKNILIEKSKVQMAAEDLATMFAIISQ